MLYFKSRFLSLWKTLWKISSFPFISVYFDSSNAWKSLFCSLSPFVSHYPSTLLMLRTPNSGWSTKVGVIISSASPQIAPLFCSGH